MSVSVGAYLVIWDKVEAALEAGHDTEFFDAAADADAGWFRSYSAPDWQRNHRAANAALEMVEPVLEDAEAGRLAPSATAAIENVYRFMLSFLGALEAVFDLEDKGRLRRTFFTVAMKPSTVATFLARWQQLPLETLRAPIEAHLADKPDDWWGRSYIASFDGFRDYLGQYGHLLATAEKSGKGIVISIG